MPVRPSAEWSGVIVIGDIEVDGRLFSATSRKQDISLVTIHTMCIAPVAEIEEAPKPQKRVKAKKEKPQIAPVARQLFCKRCQKAVPADELGKAYQTEDGKLIPITPDELMLLEPEPVKRVTAFCIKADDPLLAAFGTGRRLYFFPNPAFVENYYKAWAILHRWNLLGFIEELVIDKEKASYPVVVRPVTIPPEMADGRKRKVLVVEVVREPSEVKKPTEITTLPEQEPEFPTRYLAKLPVTTLTIDSFRNPRTKKLSRLIKKKLQ
jgi:non-homologous end joining protein Ku